MLSCHKNECSPVSYNLVIEMDAVLSHTILSQNECSPVSYNLVIKMKAGLSQAILSKE